jgi:hypothetical protein
MNNSKLKMDEVDSLQQRQIDFLIFGFVLCHMIEVIWLACITIGMISK